MLITMRLTTSLFLVLLFSSIKSQTTTYEFNASMSEGNPLRGVVNRGCKDCVRSERFPHSLEFWYLTMRSVMVGPNSFDWTQMDATLDNFAANGNQGIFRIHVDYPGGPSGRSAIPDFLFPGLTLYPYSYNGKTSYAPDYTNTNLTNAFKNLITALGAKYDEDRRVAFIQVGLLGHWGEWNGSPLTNTLRDLVLDTFDTAFSRVKILARYPGATGTKKPTDRAIGFHDDSFAYSTLSLDRTKREYFYPSLLRAGGADIWKTQPIGGETRPGTASSLFADPPVLRENQEFGLCVNTTHASWLKMAGIFDFDDSVLRRVAPAVQKLGYQFYVSTVVKTKVSLDLQVNISISNRGSAPFYYPILLHLISGSQTLLVTDKLQGMVPSPNPQIFSVTVPSPNDVLLLKLSSTSILPNQRIRFANKEIQSDGTLSIGALPPLRPSTAFKHLGCYADSPTKRTLLFMQRNFRRSNSHDTCYRSCSQAGYVVAGVEDSTQCWCGSMSQIPATPITGCTKSCPANAQQKCGGVNQMNILVGITDYVEVGCFTDTKSRILKGAFFEFGTSNSHGRCWQTCRDAGFTVAGVEYGSQCYCGNESIAGFTNVTGCTIPCSGDSSAMCGGNYKINILVGRGSAMSSGFIPMANEGTNVQDKDPSLINVPVQDGSSSTVTVLVPSNTVPGYAVGLLVLGSIILVLVILTAILWKRKAPLH